MRPSPQPRTSAAPWRRLAIAALLLAGVAATSAPAVDAGEVEAAKPSSAQREQVLYDRARHEGLSVRYLTRDDADRYIVRRRPGAAVVQAPVTNEELNTRIVIVPRRTESAVDGGSCATWTGAMGTFAQQGIALRVRKDGARARSIVVTKNVYFGAVWQFNVTTWDTERTSLWDTHGAVQLKTPFLIGKVPAPLPWTVCARTEGSLVRIKGWRSSEPEPAWTDPEHTGTVELPDGWVLGGRAGWFAGHLPPGASLAIDDLRTWASPAPLRAARSTG